MTEEFEHLNRNKKDLPVFPSIWGAKFGGKGFDLVSTSAALEY